MRTRREVPMHACLIWIGAVASLCCNSSCAFAPSIPSTSKGTPPNLRRRSKEFSGSFLTRPYTKGNLIALRSDLANGRFEKDFAGSVSLSNEEINPIIRLGSGEKEKVVNAFGFWAFFVSLITGPVWLAAMKVVEAVYSVNENFDPHREIYDLTGKLWAKAWLTLTMSYPSMTGEVDLVKGRGARARGASIYVANHASWLDIPVLCTALDPVFKFISKGELEKVPCIGDQLRGGKHILIDRDDRRSQIRTFKEAMNWLKQDVPIMAFPEGARSRDGRLMEFKGGLFSIATKLDIPIVPISISNTHAVMPGNALFPVQRGSQKLSLHIHPAIESHGLTEEELSRQVRDAILSQLPADQHPTSENEQPEVSKLELLKPEMDEPQIEKPKLERQLQVS